MRGNGDVPLRDVQGVKSFAPPQKRLIQQIFLVVCQDIEAHEYHRHLGEQVRRDRFALQAGLQVPKRQNLTVAPCYQLSVEDETSRDRRHRLDDFRIRARDALSVRENMRM